VPKRPSRYFLHVRLAAAHVCGTINLGAALGGPITSCALELLTYLTLMQEVWWLR